MIVYRELSSLCHDLGYSARALYAASNTIEKHYHSVNLEKDNGEIRILQVPDLYLKSIQKSIVRNILTAEEISPYATAYKFGGSTLVNALPHRNHSVVLKLDIRKFFDHILYPAVKEKVFTADKYSESNRILLSVLCVYQHAIPQGAPTSPMISNIVMRDFDNRVGAWCNNQGITYTRYCDDMTFSGNFVPQPVIAFVKKELFQEGFFLNYNKTVILRNGQRKEVTGIVINEKASVPAPYKKKLRQELHYCKAYGMESHMKHLNIQDSLQTYREKLLGRVNYVLSVEPGNKEMIAYKEYLDSGVKGTPMKL